MIVKEEASNTVATTFEFYVENNKIMCNYNTEKPIVLTNLMKQYPECKDHFEKLYKHILKKYPKHPYKKESNDTVEDTDREGKPPHRPESKCGSTFFRGRQGEAWQLV